MEVEELAKHYGDVHALDGISFAAAPGEVFGLLGHNGAGKSTCIRILTGRARPTSGHARVLGHELPGELEAVRAQINLVAESPTLYGRATARENLTLFCKLYDLPRSRGDEVLERVRLTHAADRKAKTFSTGMRQRLLLARALLNHPRVLFLDEPTRGLDPQSARDLHDLIRELSQGGSSIFLTTHDMHEADDLCDRVAFLADGKVVALDTPRALKLGIGGVPEADVVLDDGSQQRLRLDDDVAVARLQQLLAARRVRTLHTREPTLADVFIQLAGRTLHEPGDDAGEEAAA
ncbi:ABC transporter ATP-binding protein [Conexibacter sp. SYSU D00693]|uniref:ABC transporter ATP-binding protein n=1 Tax=Conexibacter sp. SYSU D00693 TaxID=2812560 RepID=UPI00196B5A68|nr:ABC transporter ATP-binding protein [Conexibacter sp. SYSU D00693]